MNKPDLKEVNNRDALQHGFHDVWKSVFNVAEEVNLADDSTYKDLCSGGFTLINTDNSKILKKIPYKEFWKKTTFNVSDSYNGP